MPGIFGVNTPRLLYDRLRRAVDTFANGPSEDGIFDVIFSLCHLREWIYPDSHKSYEGIPPDQRSPEQRLHADLFELAEYRIVLDLCNNAKHFEDSRQPRDMQVLDQARAGLVRAGDSLGVRHFVVDGREIRECFDAVMARYSDYFDPRS